MARTLSKTLLAVFALTAGAYLVFHARQQSYEDASVLALASNVTQPATVVFTGGPGRLKTGLELLRDLRTQRVLISGVWQGYSKANLPKLLGLEDSALECCVTLGFEARDTAGNGAESAAWLAQRSAAGMFLVTSRHHMPRAVVEMTRWAPDVRITPVSVPHPGSVRREVTEFFKYSAALARLRFLPLRKS